MPKKRLIICCDGTWKSSNHATDEIATNVARMSHCMSPWYNNNGVQRPQIVYYVAGLGAEPLTMAKYFYGGFGWGFDEAVGEIYNFLATNFCDGDELFFFGFSRGAYLALAVANLVCKVGICTPDIMPLYKYMYAVYQTLTPDQGIQDHLWVKGTSHRHITITVNGKKLHTKEGAGERWFRPGVNRRAKIKIVGAWDTVCSLGMPRNRYIDVSASQKWYSYHSPYIHNDIENAFQALAIDEHRMAYVPEIWKLPSESTTNLIQCWFPGVHSNIGGGRNTSEGDLEFLAGITFSWMIDRCYPFIEFDEQKLTEVMNWHIEAKAQLIRRMAEQNPEFIFKPYTGGPMIDSFRGIGNTVLGSEMRTPGTYYLDAPFPTTNECVHPIRHFISDNLSYRTNFFHNFIRTPNKDKTGFGWYWERQYRIRVSKGKKKSHVTVKLPEFVIPIHVKSKDSTVPSWERSFISGTVAAYQLVASKEDNAELLGYPKSYQQKWVEKKDYGFMIARANGMQQEERDIADRLGEENRHFLHPDGTSLPWKHVVQSFPSPVSVTPDLR